MTTATRGNEKEITSWELEENRLVAEIKRTAKTGKEARNLVLLVDRPNGTTVYKQDALQTPFVKESRAVVYLVIVELRDSKVNGD
ncbi:hypothetical protein IFM89_010562 [Coptis chinensis]|uniref:Uncharacterized protein n=1 Tax=Coptis chinensis TaxID=261450 RepID=A0A835MDN9_9MAGN|nr:hypothetical protein IFM89_010562 [Coptis chinensis]